MPDGEWLKTGTLGRIRFDESGWFLVRTVADNPKTFRFASTAPYYVEIGERKRRISKASAQFFLDWVHERAGRVKRNDLTQRGPRYSSFTPRPEILGGHAVEGECGEAPTTISAPVTL